MKIEYFIGALVGLSILSFLYLPTYYKFGYLKAKMFNLLLFAVAFGVPVILKSLLNENQKPLWIDKAVAYITSQSDLIIGVFLLVFILIGGVASYGVSLMVYSKREF